MVDERDVCVALEEVPHLPVAGPFSVWAFNEKLQVGLPFLDNSIALHAKDLSSRYSILVIVFSGNPLEA